MRRRWLATAVVLAAVLPALLSACASTPGPQAALSRFLAGWGAGRWSVMRREVSRPPADFAAVNAAAFAALGVTHASFRAGPVTTSSSGTTARVRVTEHFAVPQAGAWNPVTTVHLTDRGGTWRIAWSPATISPALRAGDTLALARVWPPRAAILGAGGAPLTQTVTRVTVGVVGSRVTSTAAVRTDLLAAGAPAAAASQALAQASARPDYFEPVFTVSAARFAQLRAAPGPDNVYAVRGTEFQALDRRVRDHGPAGRGGRRLGGPGHRPAAAQPGRTVQRVEHRRADRAGGRR